MLDDDDLDVSRRKFNLGLKYAGKNHCKKQKKKYFQICHIESGKNQNQEKSKNLRFFRVHFECTRSPLKG